MVQVTKIGHAAFSTPNIEAMLAYYTGVLGFTLETRDGKGAVYLSRALDHHEIILYPSTEKRLHHVAFQLDNRQTLKEAEKQLRDEGIQVELQSDAQPGIPEFLQFSDPEGNLLQVYSTIQHVHHKSLQMGIVPDKLGHLGTYVHDTENVVTFYEKLLGFRVSDRLEDVFVFLRCGADHHSANFLRSTRHRHNKLHHIAFQLRDWTHIQTSNDFLARHHIPLLWGPVRHGIGHNISTYHYDPDQNVVELFTDLDLMLNEELGYFEPRPWHEDFPQKPKIWQDTPQAMSVWGGLLPPSELLN